MLPESLDFPCGCAWSSLALPGQWQCSEFGFVALCCDGQRSWGCLGAVQGAAVCSGDEEALKSLLQMNTAYFCCGFLVLVRNEVLP